MVPIADLGTPLSMVYQAQILILDFDVLIFAQLTIFITEAQGHLLYSAHKKPFQGRHAQWPGNYLCVCLT